MGTVLVAVGQIEWCGSALSKSVSYLCLFLE